MRTAIPQLSCLCGVVLLVGGCGEALVEPQFVQNVSWALADRWMRVDTHMHTVFSDGGASIEELAAGARSHGCHGIAITDHADAGNGAAEPAWHEALDKTRAAHQFPYIIAGLEWNIPPYIGREHVNVLVHPDLEDQLAEFKASFQDGDAAAGWQWLAQKRRQPHDVVAFYNHPSRKDAEAAENLGDYLSWSSEYDVLVGFEGGPGHQRKAPRGDYFEVIPTIDGWDPVVAEVGAAWDQLLDQGIDAWGALATSDYHSGSADFLPCEYSRTHVLVPEASVEGILMALRAGAFWGEMGPFLARLDFRVSTPGLVVPAVPGESFRLGSASDLDIMVELERLESSAEQPLEVTLIGNAASGVPEQIASATLDATTGSWTFHLERVVFNPRTASAYLRVRVRSSGSTGTELAFSNAVRIYAAPP